MKLVIGVILSFVVCVAVGNPYGKLEREDNTEDANNWEESSAFDDSDNDPTDTYDDGYYASNRGDIIDDALAVENDDDYDYETPSDYDYHQRSEQTREDNKPVIGERDVMDEDEYEQEIKDEYNYYDEHDMKLYDEYYDNSEDRKVLDRVIMQDAKAAKNFAKKIAKCKKVQG